MKARLLRLPTWLKSFRLQRATVLLIVVLLLSGCPRPVIRIPPPNPCDGTTKLRVHFYDVAQGLAALVDLPDGQHILVDTGEVASRAGCGAPCKAASQHLVEQLTADLAGDPVAMVWITHQHSDHLGGAPAVLEAITAKAYVDNGTEPTKNQVVKAHDAATSHGAALVVVDLEHTAVPVQVAEPVHLRAIVPAQWPGSCSSDPNNCSIGLRIDFCASSVLFTGDAEAQEEELLDTAGPVTLLQVGHHGSDSSSSAAFLQRVAPKYAVISAGKPGEGTNRTYCHPRLSVVQQLVQALGGGTGAMLASFDEQGVKCKDAGPEHWVETPTCANLWATERDGDVVLETTGDGRFVRVGQAVRSAARSAQQ